MTHFVFMSERLNAEIVAYLPFIRKILAAKRHSIGLTQDDLNEQLGYADRLVSKWECGDRNPSTFAFECWTNTLQIDVADLLRESKEQYENHYGDRSGPHRCSNDNTIRHNDCTKKRRYACTCEPSLPLFAN